jgi:hypothetical protein
MNTFEQRDAFRELLFLDYGVEEKYITSKTIEDNFEKYDLLDESGIKATLTIDYNMKYIVESPDFTQEINFII